MGTLQNALACGLLVLGSTACVTVTRHDPRARDAAANTPAQIAALALDLEERAQSRIPVGTMRVLVEPFEEVEGEGARHRHAILAERETRAVVDTLRFELTAALGNRINVIDPGVFLDASLDRSGLRERTGATHVVVGTWFRTGDDVDVAARLVDLDDGWIVATAQQRIVDFEGRVQSLVPAQGPAGRRTARGDTRAPEASEQLLVVQDPAPSGGDAPSVPVDENGVPESFDPAAALGGSAGPGASRLGGQ